MATKRKKSDMSEGKGACATLLVTDGFKRSSLKNDLRDRAILGDDIRDQFSRTRVPGEDLQELGGAYFGVSDWRDRLVCHQHRCCRPSCGVLERPGAGIDLGFALFSRNCNAGRPRGGDFRRAG